MSLLKVTWLNNSPKSSSGVAWGTPWEKGILKRNDPICLKDDNGQTTSLQSWPMAFWPDGSVKWTGQCAVFQSKEQSYELSIGENPTPEMTLHVIEGEDQIKVDTGEVEFTINKKGSTIIDKIVNGSKIVGSSGKLISIQEVRSEKSGINYKQEIPLESKINNVEIEQSGSIRCVLKIEGIHEAITSEQNYSWMPFQLRLYFYAGIASVKMIHTFFYDGDPQTDFIKGIGIELSTSLKGEDWNRNIRFAGDEGIYSEPAQLLLTRRHRYADGLYEKQIKGETLSLSHTENEALLNHVEQNASWNDFKLTQDSADHYRIMKRTDDDCSWIESTHGTRAKGLAYVGGETGGVGIGIKNFWQKFPSTLEVSGLGRPTTKIRAWFWSPDYEAMDLRHYNKETHVASAYEGFDEMRATPVGIANTSEVYMQFYDGAPSHEDLIIKADEWQSSLLLVCNPEYYYQTKALGIWSLPDTGNPLKAMIEKQLDEAIDFYKNEIEQRRWYGYWNYGDVMHTYDSVRHQWRYDLGGFAWQNTELVPNIWLWYAFLRSGRDDIFKIAEAMTRHTSEVDCYHFGEYAGLGSRHNVSHWGCGCKEARVSMAGLHKFYYFLTTDERTKEILSEVRDADQALLNLDPMREFYPNVQDKTHARVGPDWAAFCSNWLSEWERTGNLNYRDKIVTGIDILKKLPLRLLSGPTFEYDPTTSKLIHMGDGNEGGYHMVIAFGGPQSWMEIAQLLEDDEWEDMLIEFGEFYCLSNEEKRKRSSGVLHDKLFSLPMLAAGMVAYAAAKKKDATLAKTAWRLLLNNEISQMQLPMEAKTIKTWKTLEEIPEITTNTTSQWCLNTIIALDLIGEFLTTGDIQEILPK